MKLLIIAVFISNLNIIFAQDTLELFSKAPKFETKNNNEEKLTLESLIKNGPVVITFYRGQWCPYCNKHMSDLQDSLSFINNAGATLIAITPEKNTEINKTIKKSDASFNIIYDKNHKIMDAYKVSFISKGFKKYLHILIGININKASGNRDNILPIPATYIIDSNGIIIGRHFDKDYTKRMSVAEILNVLNKEKHL